MEVSGLGTAMAFGEHEAFVLTRRLAGVTQTMAEVPADVYDPREHPGEQFCACITGINRKILIAYTKLNGEFSPDHCLLPGPSSWSGSIA